LHSCPRPSCKHPLCLLSSSVSNHFRVLIPRIHVSLRERIKLPPPLMAYFAPPKRKENESKGEYGRCRELYRWPAPITGTDAVSSPTGFAHTIKFSLSLSISSTTISLPVSSVPPPPPSPRSHREKVDTTAHQPGMRRVVPLSYTFGDYASVPLPHNSFAISTTLNSGTLLPIFDSPRPTRKNRFRLASFVEFKLLPRFSSPPPLSIVCQGA